MRVDQITTNTAYGTSLTTVIYSFLDSFTHDEWAAIGIIGGLVFGALTWIANIYFQYRRLKLMEREGGDGTKE
ncbi:TPA: lysis protein [Salmonella enterica]|uniref:Lysis protein n=1 Tax=Salmonella enterica TaxID=28901 RepID=A0A756LAF5_SALER|nr:lysis protein [Salmonella enterica]